MLTLVMSIGSMRDVRRPKPFTCRNLGSTLCFTYIGLVEQNVDPQLVATLHTFKDARQFRSVDYWASEVFPAANGDLEPIVTSPVAILVDRLQCLGFAVLPTGCLSDIFGGFHPALLNYHELEFRIQVAWQGFVAAQLQHRTEFQHIPQVDPAATRRNDTR